MFFFKNFPDTRSESRALSAQFDQRRDASMTYTSADRMMRTHQTAAYLGLSQSTLAKMRLRGDGPPYSKAGPRLVLYDKSKVDSWVETRCRISTSQDCAPSG
jgi:predicted DNA-binding transcriptional regulator AlpA